LILLLNEAAADHLNFPQELVTGNRFLFVIDITYQRKREKEGKKGNV